MAGIEWTGLQILRELPLLDRAKTVAFIAHSGQKRKYTGEDYYTHPHRVGERAFTSFISDDGVAAAFLHDVLEDTNVTEEHLRELFDKKVVKLVKELTNVYTKTAYPKLNRKKRKELELERIAGISKEAKLIKVIDRLDNLLELDVHDKPDFTETYLEESRQLVKVLDCPLVRKNAAWELLRIEINACQVALDVGCELK